MTAQQRRFNLARMNATEAVLNSGLLNDIHLATSIEMPITKSANIIHRIKSGGMLDTLELSRRSY